MKFRIGGFYKIIYLQRNKFLDSQTSTQQNSLSSASEIVQNLPKVWKVLAELLSHQSGPVSVLNDNGDQYDKNPCYKSVETPSGPTLVLSVSKTFIRLKVLISNQFKYCYKISNQHFF